MWWSGRAGDSPARGAPPLTISFTLPPSRSRTLLNTSLSNSGVAWMRIPLSHASSAQLLTLLNTGLSNSGVVCMHTSPLHASVSTSNPQCHPFITCSSSSSSSSAPACQWPLTSCVTPAVKRAYTYAIAASGSGQESAAAAGISTYCPARALQLAGS